MFIDQDYDVTYFPIVFAERAYGRKQTTWIRNLTCKRKVFYIITYWKFNNIFYGVVATMWMAMEK